MAAALSQSIPTPPRDRLAPGDRTTRREDALAFYKRFYAPNNAILVIAGDVDAKEIRPMVERAYGSIRPSRRSPRSVSVRRRPVPARRAP